MNNVTDNNQTVSAINNSVNPINNKEIPMNTAFLNTDEIQFRINESNNSATIWIDKGHGEPKAVAQFASFDKKMGEDYMNSPIAASMLKGLFGILGGRKALGVGAVVNIWAVKGREEGRILDDCGLVRGAYASKFFAGLGELDSSTVYQIGWDGSYHARPVPATGTIEHTNKFNHYQAMQALRYNLAKGFKVTISWTPARDEDGNAIMRYGESLSLLGLAKKVEQAFAVRGNKSETMKLYTEMNDKVEVKERISSAVASAARGHDLATSDTVKGYGGTEYRVDELVGAGTFTVYNRETAVSEIIFTEGNLKTVVAAMNATPNMSIEALG